jgi:magnesium transporter
MPYLSEILGRAVYDSEGEKIGTVSDLGASMAEAFPRVTSLAFSGPSKKSAFMVSWRKYVESFTDNAINLNVRQADVRFSYLQPEEILLGRSLLNKQIVDMRNAKVSRVTDIKLSSTSEGQLRLIGAEVGVRGRLRFLSPTLERLVVRMSSALGRPIPEHVVTWSYMDLIDPTLADVKGASNHASFEDMHPADIADIIEQLDPKIRAQVLRQLDTDAAAETISELSDEIQSEVIEELPEREASEMIAQMDPDDAADIVGELPFDRAEKLLNLMDAPEEKAIRSLLGYSKNTAGGIMTSEFVAMPQSSTIGAVRSRLRALDPDFEPVYYVYTLDENRRLVGVLSMRDVVVAEDSELLRDLSFNDLITVSPEDDQAHVIDEMTKYDLVDMPVVNAEGRLIGIVSVDDALDVIEEGHERDIELASGTRSEGAGVPGKASHLEWFFRRELWFAMWVVLMVIAAHVLPGAVALPFMAFLPIVLLVADDIISFASGYLTDGESDVPSLGSLIARDLIVGLLMGIVGWLIASIAVWTSSTPMSSVINGLAIELTLVAAMITVALLITSSAAITRIIAKRTAKDQSTPGTLASIGIMLAGALVFALLAIGLVAAVGVI